MQAKWITSSNREEICKKISIAKTKYHPHPCEVCNITYKPRKNHGKVSKYCSATCYHKSLFGHKMPQTTRVAIQKANIGRRKPNPCTPFKKRLRTGTQWKDWRRKVFERDNYTCQECGVRNKKGLGRTVELHPDHIKPFALFPHLRFDVSNGRTLCAPCHRKTPTWGYSSLYRGSRKA